MPTKLESIVLRGLGNFAEIVAVKDKIDLLNPEICLELADRKSQEEINKFLIKELSSPPYTIIEINFYENLNCALLKIEGRNKKTQEVAMKYFCKYFGNA